MGEGGPNPMTGALIKKHINSPGGDKAHARDAATSQGAVRMVGDLQTPEKAGKGSPLTPSPDAWISDVWPPEL